MPSEESVNAGVTCLQMWLEEEGFQGADIKSAKMTTLGNKLIEFSCAWCPRCQKAHQDPHGFYVAHFRNKPAQNEFGFEMPMSWLGCALAPKGTTKKMTMHPVFETVFETMK